MGKMIDRTEQRFGKLVALRQEGRSAAGQVIWRCRCDCGNETLVRSQHLGNGNTSSCGCEQFVGFVPNHTVQHGHAMNGASKTYMSWAAMHRRCYNPNTKDWLRYGGRGIRVCERWHDFTNFLADMGERPDSLTLDRINGNEDYSPDNCRWATSAEQAANKAPAPSGAGDSR